MGANNYTFFYVDKLKGDDSELIPCRCREFMIRYIADRKTKGSVGIKCRTASEFSNLMHNSRWLISPEVNNPDSTNKIYLVDDSERIVIFKLGDFWLDMLGANLFTLLLRRSILSKAYSIEQFYTFRIPLKHFLRYLLFGESMESKLLQSVYLANKIFRKVNLRKLLRHKDLFVSDLPGGILNNFLDSTTSALSIPANAGECKLLTNLISLGLLK